MANAGFSSPVNYFYGSIPTGLTPLSSSENYATALAEAPEEYGDTSASDMYGKVMNPSVEYAVTATVDLSGVQLGKIVTYGAQDNQKHFMMTQFAVNTQSGQHPTVTISGVEVEATATTKRTYSCFGTVNPRSKAQDVAGAFATNTNFTQITTTFAVDPHQRTKRGYPIVSDASHGRVEVSATMTDTTGAGAITASNTFTVSASDTAQNPDAGYVTRTATAVKFIAGTEAAAANTQNVASLTGSANTATPNSGSNGTSGDGEQR